MRSAIAPTIRWPGKSHAQAGVAIIVPTTKQAAPLVLRMHALPTVRGQVYARWRRPRQQETVEARPANACAPAARLVRDSGSEWMTRRGASVRGIRGTCK